MDKIKVTLSNTNIARKINKAYEGCLTRNPRRTSAQQATERHSPHARKTHVGSGHSSDFLSHQTDLLLQAILVHQKRRSDDRLLNRLTVRWMFSATTIICFLPLWRWTRTLSSTRLPFWCTSISSSLWSTSSCARTTKTRQMTANSSWLWPPWSTCCTSSRSFWRKKASLTLTDAG